MRRILLVMAIVTLAAPPHVGGQTFIYGALNGIPGPFTLVRHTAQITAGNIGSATVLTTNLLATSGYYLHDDSAAGNLHAGFKIPDGAGGLITLDNTKFLYVHKTASSGTFFYAITHGGDSTVTVGTNSLTSGVVETYQANQGFVKFSSVSNYDAGGGPTSHTLHRLIRWEDRAVWNDDWGYYGNLHDLYEPEGVWGLSLPAPLQVDLHSAGGNGFHVPTLEFGLNGTCFRLASSDLQFSGFVDPYTGATRPYYGNWFGYLDADGFAKPCLENRIIGITEAIRDSGLWSIDPNRLYLAGASLGGGGTLHLLSMLGRGVFAAGYAGVPWVDTTAGLIWTQFPGGTKVTNSSGPLVIDRENIAVQSPLREFTPMVFGWNGDDGTLSPNNWPEAIAQMETDKQPFFTKWAPGNHNAPALPSHLNVQRFSLAEAYPAFSGSTNSDTLPNIPPSSSATGGRNLNLDWHGAHHSITGGSPIVDSASSFAMSLISLSGTATTTVTIRNCQSFTSSLNPTWSTSDGQSGTATKNADGSYTVTGLVIPTTAIDLTLTAVEAVESPRIPWMRAA
jgi:hypothetical protein